MASRSVRRLKKPRTAHHGADHLAVWLPAPLGAQEAMVFANPRQFFRPPYVGPRGSYQMVARTMKRRGRGCA